MIVSGDATADDKNVISFETLNYSVALTWGATSSTLLAGEIAAAPSATNPDAAADITPDDSEDPFVSFDSQLNGVGTGVVENVIFTFLSTTDEDWAFEVGTVINLWNALDYADGVKTAVTLAGASQLAVAATATLAIALLF